jgi:biopolymer transport protein ExbD
MSMVSSAQNDEVMAEINITPFTDVLLVLLIIFMILAAIITPPGFQKQLPDKSDAPVVVQKQNKSIKVLVNENNRIFVDDRESSITSIYSDMGDVARRRGHIHVSLTADLKADYGTIIKILDAARIAGLDDVGFVTS